MPQILLVDNGSKRPGATRSLRALAERLAARLHQPVAPVSLLHADGIAPALLGGRPAQILAPYLRDQLRLGEGDFTLLPLFFGQSRALTRFIPETVAALQHEYGVFSLRVAEPLCPLPQGEPRLAEILHDHLSTSCQPIPPEQIILVDHGSPIPRVTAVRNWLAQALSQRISDIPISEAAMERRAGPEYDFNGPLLSEALEQQARAKPNIRIALAMQFLSAGRHAGEDGDVARICQAVAQRHPGVRITRAPLMGTHPLLVEVLAERLTAIQAGSTLGAEQQPEDESQHRQQQNQHHPEHLGKDPGGVALHRLDNGIDVQNEQQHAEDAACDLDFHH